MIYELSPERFHTVRPLYAPMWYDEAFIESVFDGRRPGRLFVDDVADPRAALLIHPYDYYIAGDSSSVALRRFIREAPAEVGLFEALYGYVPIGDGWKEALLEDFEGKLEVIERRGFKFHHSTLERAGHERPLPEGFSVRRIDRSLADHIDAEFHQHIGSLWGGNDIFARDGFGFCVTHGDTVASYAYSDAVSNRYASIGVGTAEVFQRQGMASVACRAFVQHCLEHGLTPTWDTDAVNVASMGLAQSLGFEELPPFYEIAMPGRARVGTSTGLWTREDADGGATVWRRNSHS